MLFSGRERLRGADAGPVSVWKGHTKSMLPPDAQVCRPTPPALPHPTGHGEGPPAHHLGQELHKSRDHVAALHRAGVV